MRATITVMALSIVLVILGCVDNDVTFFVEHVKVQPEAPQCSTSAGDDFAPSGLVDLGVASSFFNYYYVTNAAMLREDYDNIRAETDGIMVEVHPDPRNALSDGQQSLDFKQFADLISALGL